MQIFFILFRICYKRDLQSDIKGSIQFNIIQKMDQISKSETVAAEVATLVTMILEEIRKLQDDSKSRQNQTSQMLEAAKLDVQALRRKSEKVKQENQDLKRQLQKVKQENQAVRRQALKKQSDKVKQENQDLKRQLQKVKQENQAVRRQALRRQSDKLKQENQDLKKQSEKLKQENQDLKKQSEKVMQDNQDLKGQLKKVKQDNQDLKSQSEQKKQVIEELEQKLGDIQNQQNYQAKFKQLQKEEEQLYTQFMDKQKHFSGIRREISAEKKNSLMSFSNQFQININVFIQQYINQIPNFDPLKPKETINKMRQQIAKMKIKVRQFSSVVNFLAQKIKLSNDEIQKEIDFMKNLSPFEVNRLIDAPPVILDQNIRNLNIQNMLQLMKKMNMQGNEGPGQMSQMLRQQMQGNNQAGNPNNPLINQPNNLGGFPNMSNNQRQRLQEMMFQKLKKLKQQMLSNPQGFANLFRNNLQGMNQMSNQEQQFSFFQNLQAMGKLLESQEQSK